MSRALSPILQITHGRRLVYNKLGDFVLGCLAVMVAADLVSVKVGVALKVVIIGGYFFSLFFFLQTTFTDRPIIYSHDHINTTPTISRYQLFPTPFVKLHHHYYQSLLAVGGLSSLVVALAMKEPMTHLIFGLLVSFSDKVKKDDLATCRLISFLFSLS